LFIINKHFWKKSCFLFGVGLNPMNLLEHALTECTIGGHWVAVFLSCCSLQVVKWFTELGFLQNALHKRRDPLDASKVLTLFTQAPCSFTRAQNLWSPSWQCIYLIHSMLLIHMYK
jgi:hypothetical protein